MIAHYDYRLIILSITVSILAAFAVRALAERIMARGGTRVLWLIGGAAASGFGTWSMHYTAMAGFTLPVPVLYHWPTVLLSLLIGMLGSGVALFVMSRRSLGLFQTIAASFAMGVVGISSLHYTAMASMRFQGMCEYPPLFVAVSVLLAIVFCFASLSMTFLFRGGWRWYSSAIFLGVANPAMHFTALAGTGFVVADANANSTYDVTITSLGIVSISVVPVMVLVVALLTSTMDRLQKQQALLNSLFEQAPEAVVLLDANHRVLRVSRGFTRLFGYTTEEAQNRPLVELIVSSDFVPEYENYRELVASGARVDAEGIRRRKDGSLVHVSILQVSVRLPGEEIAVYAIYRDITERTQAEQQLKGTSRQLRALSARLQSAREEESTRIAREIHDELGAALSSLRWELEDISEVTSALPDPSQSKSFSHKIRRMMNLTDTTVNTVRRIASELRPVGLDTLGLSETIESQARQFQERTGITVESDCGQAGVDLNPDQSIAVFRILQEALTNILRHAQATFVHIQLKRQEREVVLTISDNGRGITEEEKSGVGTLGLLGMRERAHLVEGRIEITGAKGEGTVVIVRIPISGEDDSLDQHPGANIVT